MLLMALEPRTLSALPAGLVADNVAKTSSVILVLHHDTFPRRGSDLRSQRWGPRYEGFCPLIPILVV